MQRFLVLGAGFVENFGCKASKASSSFTDGGEIDAVRALLGSKPRPVGWAERRQRIDEVGSIWPVAGDVRLDPVDIGGVSGEWSIAQQ
jgi:hypothetical protein